MIQRKVGRLESLATSPNLIEKLIQEADMCISFTPPSITKKDSMDTSIYVQEEDTSLLIPYPTIQTDKLGILIAPFQTKVFGGWL